MKKVKIYSLFAFLVMWTACEVEEPIGVQPDNITDASVPAIVKVNQSYFDIHNIEDAFVSADIELIGNEPVDKVEVYQSFNGAQASLVSTVTDFPSTVNIDLNDAAATANIDPATLVAGDNFLYTFRIYTSDGNVFTTANTFNVSASCSSSIPVGTYTAVSSGVSTDPCPGPIADKSSQVTLTSTGDGTYEISDFSAGVYTDWYGPCYGLTTITPGTITDICNELTIGASEPYGTAVTGTGAYDPETGNITYTWTNGFGDTGTVVLTPQ